ncbi:MAG: hypothetical protein QNK11_04070 [Legionella sp.]|nr:hypothetical protein [Legionella sp.]
MANINENNIHVNKNDEFFISVAMKKGHTFLLLGVVKNGQPTLLAKIGKVFNSDRKDLSTLEVLGLKAKCVFSSLDAKLQEENLSLDGKISYAAFSINYTQYLEFIASLSLTLRKNQMLAAYQEDKEESNGNITLKRYAVVQEDDVSIPQKIKPIIERSHTLSVNNTCRHTAVELIEYVLGISHLTDNVSRHYFMDLPLTAEFEKGKLKSGQHMHVLPVPPNKKQVVLMKIYTRMENMLKLDPNGEVTITKMEALTKLYEQQAAFLPECNLADALNNIREWKKYNQDLISTFRDKSFFGTCFVTRTATSAMADELETQLSKAASSSLK